MMMGISVTTLIALQIGTLNAQELTLTQEVAENYQMEESNAVKVEEVTAQDLETEQVIEEKYEEIPNSEGIEEQASVGEENGVEECIENQDVLAGAEEPWGKVMKDSITKSHNKVYCSFNLEEAGTVTLMTQSKVYQMDVNFLDEEQSVIWHNTIKEGAGSYKLDLEAGSYTIELAAAYYTGDFEYKLNYMAAPTDEKESNNAYLSAQNITIDGASYRGFLGLNDEVDIYEINLEEAGKLNLNFDSNIRLVEIHLKDESDNSIYSEKIEGGTDKIPYSYYKSIDLSAGKYYFCVNKLEDQSAATGKYQFSFKYTPIKSDDIEPNNSVTQAQNIEIKQICNALTGYLSHSDSVDVYKFVLVNKDKIEIKYVPPFKDSIIQVMNDENETLFKTSVYEPFSRTLEAEPGTYYIKIQSEETGLYQLELVSERFAKAKLYDFAERLYQLCQGRPGDSKGIEYWADGLYKKEFTGAGATTAFIKSEEFQKRNLNDNEYVNLLYELCFDRKPDPSGCEYYTKQLSKGVTRDYVLSCFINSEEYDKVCKNYEIEKGEMKLTNIADRHPNMTQFVYHFYVNCLERKPKVVELNYWVQELVNGKCSGTTLAKNFVNSKELQAKNLSDEAYIQTLYRIFFNREAEKEGMAFWKSSLSNGSTRKALLNAFCESNEFKIICNQYGVKYQL